MSATPWEEVRRLRAMLEQTLNREQRKELDALLDAWRRAHLHDVLAFGGQHIEKVARKLVGAHQSPQDARKRQERGKTTTEPSASILGRFTNVAEGRGMKLIEWLRDYWLGIAIVGLIVAITVLVVFSELEWQTFAAEHDCKMVRTTAARSVTTIGPKGQVGVGTIAGQKCYLCDDGVERCR